MKILIADSASDFVALVLRAFAKEADFEVVGCTDNGCEVLSMVEDLEPDILLMDTLLPGLDGLSLLRKLMNSNLPRKPFAFILASVAYPAMLDEAKGLPVQYFMMKPVDLEAVVLRIRELFAVNQETAKHRSGVALPPLGASQPFGETKLGGQNLSKDVEKILRRVGVPTHLLGYRYLREAVLLTALDQEAANSITKTIYPTVAQKFSSTRSRVERDIDYAIGAVWKQSRTEALMEEFGTLFRRYEQKPTNSEFIAAMANMLTDNS